MSYRPVCDTWILARSKVKYYGAFPSGFLHRARHLLGVHINDPVLFVCGGKVRDYPYRGFGPKDKTLDLDPACVPDFLQDAREPFPRNICDDPTCLTCQLGMEYETTPNGALKKLDMAGPKGALWHGVLIDRPYTEADADHYTPGRAALPTANELVKNALAVLDIGSRVGILDYVWPQPPKNAIEQAVITVVTGRNNRSRLFTVFERMS